MSSDMTPIDALNLLDHLAAQAVLNRADTHKVEEAVAILRAAIAEPEP